MGADLYAQLPAARAVFDTADTALGVALSGLCFTGPEAELTLTTNTQPALVTHAIAALVAALDAGKITHSPAFVAGHSLGEYAALVAAGSVTFEEGVRLVRERGEAMQAACDAQPGTMAAVLERDGTGGNQRRVLAERVAGDEGGAVCDLAGIER
ncbi:MAG: ACP S-malonyltransferase, partial [Dehalococcoidia bacterium]